MKITVNVQAGPFVRVDVVVEGLSMHDTRQIEKTIRKAVDGALEARAASRAKAPPGIAEMFGAVS